MRYQRTAGAVIEGEGPLRARGRRVCRICVDNNNMSSSNRDVSPPRARRAPGFDPCEKIQSANEKFNKQGNGFTGYYTSIKWATWQKLNKGKVAKRTYLGCDAHCTPSPARRARCPPDSCVAQRIIVMCRLKGVPSRTACCASHAEQRACAV